jgi:hypothetical protein
MKTRLMTKLAFGALALCAAVIANALPLIGNLFLLPIPLGREVPQPAPLALFGVAVLVLGMVLRHYRGPHRQ